jgi:hypothetical protein
MDKKVVLTLAPAVCLSLSYNANTTQKIDSQKSFFLIFTTGNWQQELPVLPLPPGLHRHEVSTDPHLRRPPEHQGRLAQSSPGST